MIETLESGRDAVVATPGPRPSRRSRRPTARAASRPRISSCSARAGGGTAHPDEATEALERAFAGYTDAGRPVDAARVAMTLAYQGFRGLACPVGGGWLARAERLLAEEPESALHARLGVFHALGALMQGQLEEGIALADRAMEVARRQGNDDALYLAMSFKGWASSSAATGRTGLAHIDEAAAAASSGPARPARRQRHLLQHDRGLPQRRRPRARRPVGRRGRALDAPPDGAGGYPGICRIHRAELKMLRGQWSEAEQEARQACEELRTFRLLDAIGLRPLRRSARSGCGWATSRARPRRSTGLRVRPRRPAGPGLLQLARGEVDDARRSIDRALASPRRHGRRRRPGDARLACCRPRSTSPSRPATSRRRAAAVEELESIATDFERPLFQAGALTARGELLLGEDKPAEASPVLGQSWRLWQTTDLPYESARARLRYAEALAGRGRPGHGPARPARRPLDVRAARRDARPASASTRCSVRTDADAARPPAAAATGRPRPSCSPTS